MTTLEPLLTVLPSPLTGSLPDAGPRGRRSPGLLSSKIAARHLDRVAVVYVRQSSARQVVENCESTQLQ
jgi:hypothetical protein